MDAVPPHDRARHPSATARTGESDVQVVVAKMHAGLVEVLAGDLAGGEAALEEVER
jgi:hypothetical protein